jgi:transcriptional regulator with XRE-family HTH domain
VAAVAHPPDPALIRAVAEAIGALRAKGMSTRQIATEFGVSDPTITRWENGDRAPRLDQLPVLDALCGKTRGYVLTLAGYVEPMDIEAAIESDPALTPFGRRTVAGFYRYTRDEFDPGSVTQ